MNFSGAGKEVIEFGSELDWLKTSVGLFQFEVSGSGNNAVWGLDEDFESADLLVNTIGGLAGSRFIGLDYTATGLEVDVSGSWAFTITPLTKRTPTLTLDDFWIPVIDTTGTYSDAETQTIDWKGPAIVALKTDQRIAEITASGDGNIAIWVYNSKGDADLLVNEIDDFSGSVRLIDCSDGCFLDIDGEMVYSLSVR